MTDLNEIWNSPSIPGFPQQHIPQSSRTGSGVAKDSVLDYDKLREETLLKIQGKSVDDELMEPISIDAEKLVCRFQEIKSALATLLPQIEKTDSKIEALNKAFAAAKEKTQSLFEVFSKSEHVDLVQLNAVKDAQTTYESFMETNIKNIQDHYKTELKDLEERKAKLLINKGALVSALSVTVMESLDKAERDRLVGGKLCAICTVHDINRVLECGHVVCSTCLPNLKNKCFMCRKAFAKATPLYLITAEGDTEVQPEVTGLPPSGFSGFEQFGNTTLLS